MCWAARSLTFSRPGSASYSCSRGMGIWDSGSSAEGSRRPTFMHYHPLRFDMRTLTVFAATIALLAGRPALGQDSSFGAMQKRGKQAMGVDQYTSTHKFDALPDGGRIELQRNSDDSAGVATIRAHVR